MMVDDMLERMSNQEFLNWGMFYAKRAQEQELNNKMAEAKGR